MSAELEGKSPRENEEGFNADKQKPYEVGPYEIGPYEIDLTDRLLKFSTTSFKAERGSLLHAGIYSSELTSTLVAGGVVLTVFFAVSSLKGFDSLGAWHVFTAMGLFSVVFLFIRKFLFFEKSLEVLLDKDSGAARIVLKGFRALEQTHALSDITDVSINSMVISPENPDASRVVEKIAVHHGTVLPGFSEDKTISWVELKLRGQEAVTVFSTENADEARAVSSAFKGFLKGEP